MKADHSEGVIWQIINTQNIFNLINSKLKFLLTATDLSTRIAVWSCIDICYRSTMSLQETSCTDRHMVMHKWNTFTFALEYSNFDMVISKIGISIKVKNCNQIISKLQSDLFLLPLHDMPNVESGKQTKLHQCFINYILLIHSIHLENYTTWYNILLIHSIHL